MTTDLGSRWLDRIAYRSVLRHTRATFAKFAVEVTPAEAPELHGLVAQVASAVGVRSPAIYVEEDMFNASADSYGLRRHRTLVLGLPLWNALSRQQRVALLGHELGHFVNGDPRRGLVVQPAFTTLHRVSGLLRPTGTHGYWARLLLRVVTGPLRAVLVLPRLGLQILAFRDGQRAEYRADRLAATAAGRTATVDLLDLLTVSDSLALLVKRDARAGRPVAEWPTTIAGLLAEIRPQLATRREAELRDRLSLFASHPPNGLRAQLVQAQANESAAVVLSEAANARIDQKLAKHSTRSARTLKSL